MSAEKKPVVEHDQKVRDVHAHHKNPENHPDATNPNDNTSDATTTPPTGVMPAEHLKHGHHVKHDPTSPSPANPQPAPLGTDSTTSSSETQASVGS